MRLLLSIFIVFLLFNISCTDDDEVMENPKIEALKFLNTNSTYMSKIYSGTFEQMREIQGLDGYEGVDILHYFEIQSDYSFRFIAELSDCNYFATGESLTMLMLSNANFEDIYFTDIDSMQFSTRIYEDTITSSSRDYYELLFYVNREVLNFNEFYVVPGLITSTSTADLCNYNLDSIVEPFSTSPYFLEAIRLISFDKEELEKFQNNVKILAEL